MKCMTEIFRPRHRQAVADPSARRGSRPPVERGCLPVLPDPARIDQQLLTPAQPFAHEQLRCLGAARPPLVEDPRSRPLHPRRAGHLAGQGSYAARQTRSTRNGIQSPARVRRLTLHERQPVGVGRVLHPSVAVDDHLAPQRLGDRLHARNWRQPRSPAALCRRCRRPASGEARGGNEPGKRRATADRGWCHRKMGSGRCSATGRQTVASAPATQAASGPSSRQSSRLITQR